MSVHGASSFTPYLTAAAIERIFSQPKGMFALEQTWANAGRVLQAPASWRYRKPSAINTSLVGRALECGFSRVFNVLFSKEHAHQHLGLIKNQSFAELASNCLVLAIVARDSRR